MDVSIEEISSLVIAMNRHSNITTKRDYRKHLEFRLVTGAIAMTEKGLLKISNYNKSSIQIVR